MRGDDMRGLREKRGMTQPDFADWLNERLGRKYDRAKISRWETGSEKVPQSVALLVLKEMTAAAAPDIADGRHGPALTATLSNRKGGVGKTVSSTNISAGLAQRGYSVLLIDADPQANATMCFAINPLETDKKHRTLYHLFKTVIEEPQATPDLGEYVVRAVDTALDVLPATIRLDDADAELKSRPHSDFTLREILADARKRYDFIIIDTPPHFGTLTINALTAADAVLIPCQTESLSVWGVERLLRNIDLIQRRANPRLSVLGILPTMFDRRLTQDRDSLDDIQRTFGKDVRIFPLIPRATVYAQAVAAGRAALEAVPDAPSVSAYESVLDALIAQRLEMVKTVEFAHG
jgi:chromosome partitioning protein